MHGLIVIEVTVRIHMRMQCINWDCIYHALNLCIILLAMLPIGNITCYYSINYSTKINSYLRIHIRNSLVYETFSHLYGLLHK